VTPLSALFVVVVPLYALAAAASVWPARRAQIGIGNGAAAAGSAAALVVGAGALRPASDALAAVALLPAGSFAFRLDGLSAVFLVLIGLVGTASGVYAIGYSGDYRRSQLATMGIAQVLFLSSMILTVVAANAFTFLFAWELMSIAAYLMVVTDGSAETVSAANWYMAIAHAGFAAVAAAFLLMSAGELTVGFDVLSKVSHPTALKNLIFLLALGGFAAKAGIIPLHIWLPLAHPVAPSHGSALMSAAVIKMGAYGLVRVSFDLLGGGPSWWGGLVLALGAASAVVGLLLALVQQDLKRLLAYSSVENIGIVFMGLGASLLFRSEGLDALATAALVAAIYHALNHAAFKGLLFMGAGSIVHATGTRNMELLGGLIHRMPWTAALFLIGACAISALPPLNGFASEWLLFHTLFGAGLVARPVIGVTLPVAIAALALSGGLAAACFVKAFGISFLALPRSGEAAEAHESPLSMRAAMTLLALCCVALGLMPGAVTSLLARALVEPGAASVVSAGGAVELVSPSGVGRVAPLAIGALLVATIVLAALVVRAIVGGRIRIGDTWGCGRLVHTSRMEYTAAAFAEPLRRVFRELYRPTEDLVVETHPESPYFIQGIEYRSDVNPWIERVFYRRLSRAVERAGRSMRRLQMGSLHVYLLYLLSALIGLLIASAWL